MKIFFLIAVGVGLVLLNLGCRSPMIALADPEFEVVAGILESNCVHCHGKERLATMPSIRDSVALAKLIGSGLWIVPGKPEQSRLFQVVTFPDAVPGAMPPTGHAISAEEVAALRRWILQGAKVPSGNRRVFIPRGTAPRSV